MHDGESLKIYGKADEGRSMKKGIRKDKNVFSVGCSHSQT